MQVWQIAEWFKRENPEEDTITTIVTRDPTLAPKFVEAIGQVWNGPEEQDDRDYLIAGIAAIVGSGVAPSGSEGVEGTAPPDNPPPVEVEGTPDDQEYPPSEPVYPGEGTPEPEGEPEGETEVDATESAKTYAAEKGIDLSQVTGSGSGGTITKADVQAYES
jgi:pyruvate/2-oxoglutarate dehydrogenase complex dihydrolipoamide acyltransferase (E2) component